MRDIVNTPTRPRRQPLRLRTCTDFDRWTGGVKHRLAHLACAALLSSTWLLFCALFSRLCSGSQLLGSRLFCSRVAALPGSRLCSPAWLSLFWLCSGSARNFRLSLARLTNLATAPVGCWHCSAQLSSAQHRLSTALLSASPLCLPLHSRCLGECFGFEVAATSLEFLGQQKPNIYMQALRTPDRKAS